MKPIIKFFVCLLLLFSTNISFSQCINVTPELQEIINKNKIRLDELKKKIENEIDLETTDVYINSNNLPSYANWIRFLQIADKIDKLNEEWDNAYANSVNGIMENAVIRGWCGTPPVSSSNYDCASEQIEDNLLVYPEEYASVYFESKFNTNSLRLKVNEEEDNWLLNGAVNIDENPAMAEDLDEDVWPLLGKAYGAEIRNTEIDEMQLNTYEYAKNTSVFMSKMSLSNFGVTYLYQQGKVWDKIKKILGKVKPIAEAIGAVVTVVKGIFDINADCGESKESNLRQNKRQGFTVSRDGFERVIAYELEQRSVTFDGKAAVTKIRGKAKLYKTNSSGRARRKDRDNKVGIEFCTKQFDVCNKVNYPTDDVLIVPNRGRGPETAFKKTKIRRLDGLQPFALVPTSNQHFLKFSFFFRGYYEKTIPLLVVGNALQNDRCN